VAAAVKQDLAAGAQSLTFCEFRDAAKTLHSQFRGSGLVIGGDSPRDRADTIEQVASSGTPAVFATTGALDSALNMQTIDRVNYASLGWDPSTFPQTAGRAWRQGRQDPALLRRFVFPNDDLEKYIESVLLQKEEVLKTLGLLPTLSMGQLLAS
jgi:superfamily II DNA or RNA helicase